MSSDALPAVNRLDAWRSSPHRHVVFLHGYDADPAAYDLAPLEQALGSTSILRLVGAIDLGATRAWWDALELGNDLTSSAATGMTDSINAQLAMTHAVIAKEPIVLIGFSQGGAAAIAYALLCERADLIAAVVSVAGFLPCPIPAESRSTMPFLLIHPTDDEIVDMFLGERAARQLAKSGANVSFVEIEGGHMWSTRTVLPIANFLLDPSLRKARFGVM